jgi:hypothetical protein
VPITGLDKDRFPEFYNEGEDAWVWHLNRLALRGADLSRVGASGNGGQLLMVIPELELVVVFTAGNYGQVRPSITLSLRRLLLQAAPRCSVRHLKILPRAARPLASSSLRKRRSRSFGDQCLKAPAAAALHNRSR